MLDFATPLADPRPDAFREATVGPPKRRRGLVRDNPQRVASRDHPEAQPAGPQAASLLGAALALLVDGWIGHAASLLVIAAAALAFRPGRRQGRLVALTLALLVIRHYLFAVFGWPPSAATATVVRLALYASGGLLINSLAGDLQSAFRIGSGPLKARRPRRIRLLHGGGRSRLSLESSSQSKERLRLLVEGVKNYAIVMLDPEGRVAKWSTGAERITGDRAEEVVGRPLSVLYPGEAPQHARLEQDLTEAVKDWIEVEGWTPRRDGTRIWLHVGVSALRDEAGRHRGFAAVVRDLTARKQADEALRQAHETLEARVRERTAQLASANQVLRVEVAERQRAEAALRAQSEVLHSILDNMAEAVLVADEAGELLLSNPAAERMFGVARARGDPGLWPLGNGPDTPGLPTPAWADGTPLGRSIRGEAIDDLEMFLRHPGAPDGTWVLINGRPLRDPGGALRGGVIVGRDITGRRRAAEELQRAKEAAEAANRAKDRFLAALSHELRTPLTPVLATVTGLLEEDATAAELRPSLEMIRRCVELEARLINDLLDMSRIRHGKLCLSREVVDVHELIRQALRICHDDLSAKHLRLTLDLAATRPYADADPARLQQVFWNLIKNAVKFTPGGGTITIRSCDLEGARAGGHMRVAVHDTGIGIAPEALPRIFEPFEQGGPGTPARQCGGLGLGLAISRGVVEAHGGRITAASDGPSRGATLAVELPTRDAPEPAPTQPVLPPVGRGGLGPGQRILLVEDDLPSQQALAQLLQRRRHEVVAVATVGAALDAARAGDFDLLISDLGLPDGTGWDLMHRLQAMRPIRGIALTGYAAGEDVRQSRDSGFLRHLTKPIDLERLEEAILELSAHPATEGRER